MRSELVLDRERTVLAVIDMQETFLKSIKVRESIQDNILRLIHIAQILEIPILGTTQNSEKLGGMLPELVAEVSFQIDNKLAFSAWREETFASHLQQTGRTQVLLTGIEAHICVMQTALDLIQAGYQVHIPYNAVASREKRDWKYALYRLQSAGAIITSTESAIYEWLREVGTDTFRQVLPLLKQAQEEDKD